MEYGQKYWVAFPTGCAGYTWANGSLENKWLKQGCIQLEEDQAELQSNAVIKAVGGEV